MKLIISLLIVVSLCAVSHGKTLAIVNGTAIKDSDFHIPEAIQTAGDEQVQVHLSRRVDTAIDQELLRQGAMADGVHEDPEYLEMLAAEKIRRQLQAPVQLAVHYENNAQAFAAAADTAAVTDEEIEAEYQANEKMYGRLAREKADRIIRTRLSQEKRRALIPDLLRSVVGATTVKVDGVPVSADQLNAAIDRNLQGGVHEGIGPLWQAIIDAKALTVPADLKDTEAEDTLAFTKAIGAVTVTVGKSSVKLSDTPQIQAVAAGKVSLTMDAWLFFIVKANAVANHAQAEGYHESPEYIEQQANNTSMTFRTPFSHYGGIEPSALVKYYLHKGIEVTEDEIDEQFHENVEHYAQLEARFGPEQVRQQIESNLIFQKVRERRAERVDTLRAKAKIETK
jgi:hypothetical protein